ncbi:hypothetical protein EDP1_3789 [Pseudomonas putida S610]|nr:hypothetical protein EDP1_3789 [Pseudomonas putida S610]
MIADRPDYLRLFEVCARLELYTHPASGVTDESSILSDSPIMVACMAFPMLEASLKNACSKYVGSDGVVCHDFSIANENGVEKKYGRGCRISSVMIYLFIYRQHIAGDEAIRAIDIICSNLVKFYPKEHPFKVIFDWRNSTMHGEEAVETAGLILMCLAYIIEMSCFLGDYDKIRDDSIDICINSVPNNRLLIYRFPI